MSAVARSFLFIVLRTRLGTCGNLQLRLAGDGRDVNLSAERGRDEVDRDFAVNIVAVSLEKLVVADGEDDEEVAVVSSAQTGFAFARNTHSRAGIDARRNAEMNFAFDARGSRSAAVRTLLFRY